MHVCAYWVGKMHTHWCTSLLAQRTHSEFLTIAFTALDSETLICDFSPTSCHIISPIPVPQHKQSQHPLSLPPSPSSSCLQPSPSHPRSGKHSYPPLSPSLPHYNTNLFLQKLGHHNLRPSHKIVAPLQEDKCSSCPPCISRYPRAQNRL